MRLQFLLATLAALPGMTLADDWQNVLDRAKGQTVYWFAWGGDQRTNDFILYVSDLTEDCCNVTIEQVKLDDTAVAVNRVLAEKTAGQTDGGAVDLIWINGPNFLAMKSQDLLHGPFAADLPNAEYLDLSKGSPAATDFTVPVDGMESAWRLARFVFQYDTAQLDNPPMSIADLPHWAEAHPGRFTHPVVTNFMGATFLKQALVSLTEDPSVLQSAPTDDNYATVTAPLWAWYDALRPNLWHEGKQWPENASIMEQMLNDGEIDVSMAFDPAAAAAAIEQGLLPATVKTYALDGGMIGNISFVAIPFNAAHIDGAKVVANMLLD
ncbi:MAG: ABC transporter substrate-binding protein, partial [Deltaproteobacteria bacterium]